MSERLILLTGEFDARSLVGLFNQVAPAMQVNWVTTAAELQAAASETLAGTRLVAFCSGVIVPRAVLSRLDRPAYNFHPGPPTYPGCHPECWAAYFGASRFAATLHKMAPRVDEGPIIDSLWFDLPENPGQRLIARRAFEAAVQLILRWAEALAGDADLAENGEQWSGRKWRRADQEPLRLLPADIDCVEFERRRRSFADIPGARLYTVLHGTRFEFVVPPDAEPRQAD